MFHLGEIAVLILASLWLVEGQPGTVRTTEYDALRNNSGQDYLNCGLLGHSTTIWRSSISRLDFLISRLHSPTVISQSANRRPVKIYQWMGPSLWHRNDLDISPTNVLILQWSKIPKFGLDGRPQLHLRRSGLRKRATYRECKSCFGKTIGINITQTSRPYISSRNVCLLAGPQGQRSAKCLNRVAFEALCCTNWAIGNVKQTY